MSSWAIGTSEQFNHPVRCWRGDNVLWDYLQRNLIAKSIKCWLLLALLPIVNKWFWQCIQTGKSIPEGFTVVLGFCIHVNMGSGFLHTSERDYLSPLEACPAAEEDAALSLSLQPAGRWYLNITNSNLTYANTVWGLFFSGCPRYMSMEALISECSSRITVAHLVAAA